MTESLTREYVLEQLRSSECRVIFKKADGSERDMKCTLQKDMMPEWSLDENSNKENKMYNEQAIRVIDTKIQEWRSFRLDSIISFTCV